jgi:hypothetical protein
MKTKTLIAIGLCAFIALIATSSSAQEKSDKKPAAPAPGGAGHSHFTKIPATVPEIWAAIRKQQEKLKTVVEKKDLGEAHDHAFAIRDLVKALPEKIAAEHKTTAEASAKEIAKFAADIDKSGAAGAQKATEENVKKLDAAVKALEAKLKPGEVKK